MNKILLYSLASALLQPPGLILILALPGLILEWLGWRWSGNILLVMAIALLYGISTPEGARLLLAPLEDRYPPLLHLRNGDAAPQAIVVLGGGEVLGVPGPDPDTANARTLMRLQAAAQLSKATHLPLIPSGGAPRLGAPAEAITMAQILRQDFDVNSPIWPEGHSYNTAANARDSAILLRQHHLSRIYLVSSALHLPRAMAWFQYYGVHAIPVPCDYRMGRKGPQGWEAWLPRAVYLEISSEAMHEYAGLAWFMVQTRYPSLSRFLVR